MRRLPLALAAAVALLALAPPASGQSLLTENTLQLDPGSSPAGAAIQDVAWIEGTWRGEALGGTVEEIWSEPAAGTMMGAFRLIRDDEVVFYEILTISEVEDSIILRLKHFDAQLRGWEEKDETVDFELVRLEPGAAYFDGMTFRSREPDTLHIYVAMSRDDGSTREGEFLLRRAGR